MFIILGTYSNYAMCTGNSDFPRECLQQIFDQRWRVFAYNLLVVIHENRATTHAAANIPEKTTFYFAVN